MYQRRRREEEGRDGTHPSEDGPGEVAVPGEHLGDERLGVVVEPSGALAGHEAVELLEADLSVLVLVEGGHLRRASV